MIKKLRSLFRNKKQALPPLPPLPLAKKNLQDISKIEKEKKVFVIGMSKTGTTSMEHVLVQLGYRVCRGHWRKWDTNFLCACYYYNDLDEILNITNYYDAFADAPWGGTDIYEKLVESYPDAYYILTIRDTSNWYLSFIKMYEQYDNNLKTAMETIRSFGAYGNYLFFRKIFNIDNLYNNEKKIKIYYENYNKKVKNFFKNKRYNFIVIDITKKDFDVNIIMQFLQKRNIKIKIMPHLNKGKYQK